MKFFLDTYAMVEVVKGNKNYARYLDKEVSTNMLNLYELYFVLLRNFGAETAKKHFQNFKKFRMEVEDSCIFLASQFKLAKKDVSFADALGYIMAKENWMKFLTGY